MTVKSYFPTKPEAVRELQARVAKLHAEIVARQLLDLSAPKEQKLKLLDAVKDINASSVHVGTAG